MATNLQCTAFFGSTAGHGWSEGHFRSVSTPPGNLLPYLLAFKNLMDVKRKPLLGADCYLKGLRVAYTTATGQIASSPYRYVPFAYGTAGKDGAAPNVSCKVRMGEAANQQFSDIHLRGFWDSVEKNEELDFLTGDGPSFKLLLDSYTAQLVSDQYGWLGTFEANTRRGDVSNYVSVAGQFLRFTVAITSGPAFGAAGTILPVKFSRLNESNSSLNTTLICKVIDATTLETVPRVAALPFLSAGTFIATAKAFLPYSGVQYTILGRKSAGVPFGLGRGRSKARAKG